MKQKFTYVVFFMILYVKPFALACDNEEEVIGRELNEIIQLAIDAKEIQGFYHIESMPDRKPLKISLPKEIEFVTLSSVTKFGEPVKKVSRSTNSLVFNIRKYAVHFNGVNIEAAYEPEGLMVNYEFLKIEGKWILNKTEVAEK